jgi:pimeloyl-ACP methyl ester carboxylesterase
MKIEGFSYARVRGADGVELNVAVGGSGTPVVLLHGFPQTHLMWRHVARELAAEHTVICPDLRGYGASDKPAGDYSKRVMAADVVTMAAELGSSRFALAGHDRGALVAFRAGLDHPAAISHLMCLDVPPTLDMWDVMHGTSAAVGFHLYLMAQPAGLPERLIDGAPDEFFGYFLDLWAKDPAAIPADVRATYLAAARQAVPSIVADYRASATVDVTPDREDLARGNKLRMPVTVIQQDWGSALGFDAAARWKNWTTDLHHQTTTAGHFLSEQNPAELLTALRSLLGR